MQPNPSYTDNSSTDLPDLTKYPNAQKFLEKCQDFLASVENLTPGPSLETHLNTHYPPSSETYASLSTLALTGLREGWLANIPISGPHYRRSKLCLPCAETKFMSITAVYMESVEVFRGQYHRHPYGEINCVVQVDPGAGAELRGMDGWCGAGWTSPGAGTKHYPEVRGGAVVAVFFLPAGRIAYDVEEKEESESAEV